ncbi:MAG: ABC transporter ATP-binding protein [Flavobacteriales bacterium]
MKNILTILKLTKEFKLKLFLNILFTNVGVVFSIFSLALLIPVLDIFFNHDFAYFQQLASHPPPSLNINKESIVAFVNYKVAVLVADGGKEKALMLICGFLLLMVLFKNLFHYLGMLFISMIANGVVRNLRNKLFAKISTLHLGFFSGEKKGDLLSRMTSDMKEIEWSILSSVEASFKSPFEILGNLVFLFIISPQLTLFILIFLPISGLVISLIGRSLRKTSRKGQNKMGDILSLAEETIGGIKIIKAFNASDYIYEKFKSKNHDYYKTMIRLYRRSDLASPMSEFMGVAATAVLLWYGGKLVFAEQLNASVFIVYIMLFAQLITPFKTLSKAFYNAQRGLASLDRINEVIYSENEIKNSPNALNSLNFSDEISFDNISFKYGTDYILKDISITIQKGKTVALVGQSGSGKTTLAYLLPRFYDVQEGQIKIDGKNIKNYSVEALRSIMGMVTQESILFNDTIFNNIAFGINNASEEEVVRAAKIANAHEFIVLLEQGYQTTIGDGGGRLSGGQRQRISIARAVLKNPDILILDEATSALDTESEKLVQEALNNLMKDRTSIVIAHRLSTIKHADEIIVMEKGEVKERGTHDVLIAKNGTYKRLIDMQSFA